MSKNIDIDALVQAANTARDQAYAPYSRFPVGAAVLDETGQIHQGCNVENASYPQGICAEAAAITTMVMQGQRRIVAIAVAGPATDPCTPCGGCRQKIREFATAETPIVICSPGGILATYTLQDLLPHAFGPENLD